MVVRALIAQNLTIGCAFGGFGVTLLALQARYQVPLGVVSMGLALVVLTMSLAGPFVAVAVRRLGLRATMLIGITLSGSGYVVLALAGTIAIALVAFALLIGIGVALSGSLPTSLLAGGWYPHMRGRAVGIAMMPILVMVMPIVGQSVIAMHGLSAFYGAMALLHLVLVPVILGVRDPPFIPDAREVVSDDPGVTTVAILRRPAFWCIVLGGGLLNAVGITGVSHIVAIAVERGIAPSQAAMIAAILGGASIAGSLVSGWCADRFGGAWAMATMAAAFAIGWAVIANTTLLAPMIAATLLIGMAGSGVFTASNVLITRLFGFLLLGRVIGLMSLFGLPLLFLLPPAAGLLHDRAASYAPVMLTIVAICAATAALLLFVGRSERRVMAGVGV
nr:MFS transporter [Sphingomonas liriopis]